MITIMADKGHLFNIKILSEKTGIPYGRLYRGLNGGYATITEDEIKVIKQVLFDGVKRYVKILDLVYE